MAQAPEGQVDEVSTVTTTRWQKVQEVIWDGHRSKEERKLVRRLDLFLLSWATYGYFIRLLDATNITNAYVSGMRDDLNFQGNQYNLLFTFFTAGYLVGQIPSQLILTRIRPSWYLPTLELLWSCLTFTFAAVQHVRHVFALRFLIGVLESGFAVGVITVMGAWYTPRELAKRIAIFYSASYAASMFSGYLQAGIYRGMNGHLGMAGWRWLFIFCGVISLPGAFWGFYAAPDNPYDCKVRWLSADQKQKFIERAEKFKKGRPVRLSWAKIRKIFTSWRIYVVTLTLIAHCVVTQPLNYFAVWLQSLERFSVYQMNLFPTAAQALGLVTTLLFGWVSDGLGGKRWQVLIVPAAWVNEFCRDDAEERAIVIGVAQTFGQAFVAWVPLLILNVGKYAPRFHFGFSVMSGVSVLQFGMIFVIRFFVNRAEEKKRADELANDSGSESKHTADITADDKVNLDFRARETS